MHNWMWSVLGTTVGVVLGLTGAGGAILALPLLQHWGEIPLTTASVIVLPIVTLSALIVALPKWRDIQRTVLVWVILAAVPSAYLIKNIKPHIPENIIVYSIIGIIVWGLWQTWKPNTTIPASASQHSLKRSIALGLTMGSLTTLTGLGGGIVLMPLLKRYLMLTDTAAAATSVGIVATISLLAFGLQAQHASTLSIQNYSALIIGLLAANAATVILVKWCTKRCFSGLRKILYTLVLGLTLFLLL